MELFLKEETKVSVKTLRCGDKSGENILIGSFDKKVYLYKKTTSLKFERHFDCFDHSIYSIRFVTKETFVVGLMDGSIYYLHLNGDLIHIFQGQTTNVCSLDTFAGHLVSGHWGGICIVWDLQTFKELKSLPDHVHAVTVRFLPTGDLVTGSQNGILTLWRKDTFEKVTFVEGHTDIIRDIQVDSGNIFTCSNDCHVSAWTYQLLKVSSLKVHSSFVYSLSSKRLPNGWALVFSGGEDFKVKISQNGVEVGLISYPTTIWKVIASESSNEVIVLGEDGYMRIFTTNPSEVTDHEKHNEFVQSAEIAGLKNPELSEQDLSKFPKIEQLDLTKGKKEGEIKVFINKGKGEAYVWQEGKWVYVGEMVGANATMGERVYEGDKFFPQGNYDFIFDVQDDSGTPRLLPYNKSDNVLIATEKFLAREKLSVSFKEQIMHFIIKNSKGSMPAQNVAQETKVETMSSNNPKIKQLAKFPIVDYVFFETFNKNAAVAKIKEINLSLEGKEEEVARTLTKLEIVIFEKFVEKVSNLAMEHETSIEDSEEKIIERKILKWTDESALVCLDIIRVYVLHHDSVRLLNGVDSGIKFFVYAVSFSKFEGEKYLMLILRFLCNIFKNNARSFLKCDSIVKDFLEFKGGNFTAKVLSLFLTLLSNLISGLIENQLDYDFVYLLKFVAEKNLGFVDTSKSEAVNFAIAIGNCLCSHKPEVRELILGSSLKAAIAGMTQNTDGLIEDIKGHLGI